MNKKGQELGLGVIMVSFIVILLGVIFTQSIAQEVGSSVNTVALANQSETLAANGADIYIEEWKAISSVVILNATDNTLIGAGNYTVTNNVINPTTGELSLKITTDDAAYASSAVKVSGTVQPLTYISDGGSRAMANLIVVMFALAVAVIALGPTIQSRMLEGLGR